MTVARPGSGRRGGRAPERSAGDESRGGRRGRAEGWRGAAAVVVTCEHAGNRVPREYRRLFVGDAARRALQGHRGWDPGALRIGYALATALQAPFVATEITRLLVDANRTSDRAGLYSEFTRDLPADVRQEILRRFHAPHWQAVVAALEESGPRVLHLASHSFTALPGRIGYQRPPRRYEVGLLFDPRRPAEAEFVRLWRREILRDDPELEVRLNQPYRGWTDGMTTVLRERFGPRYLGVELECNQACLAQRAAAARLQRALISSLRRVLGLVTMGRAGASPDSERRERA